MAQKRSESQLPDWLCFTEWFFGEWGVEAEPRGDIMHTSSDFLTKQTLKDFHERLAAVH